MVLAGAALADFLRAILVPTAVAADARPAAANLVVGAILVTYAIAAPVRLASRHPVRAADRLSLGILAADGEAPRTRIAKDRGVVACVVLTVPLLADPLRAVLVPATDPTDALLGATDLAAAAVLVAGAAADPIGLAGRHVGGAARRRSLRGPAADARVGAARSRLARDRGVDALVAIAGAALADLGGTVGGLATVAVDAVVVAADLA